MGLFSKLGKNKQDSTPGDGDDSGVFTKPEESTPQTGRNRRKTSSSERKPRGEAVDPMLPEKKRARRRLIGSVALVLALVITLPMVLDTAPKPLDADIAIQIPARDAPENRQPLRQPPANSPLGMPGEADPVEEIIELPMTPKRVPLHAATKPESGTNAGKPGIVAQTEPPKAAIDRVSLKSSLEKEAEKQAESRQKRPIAAGDAAETKGKAEDEAKAESRREQSKSATEKKAERIVLQVAALTSQDKVAELQTKLAGAGVRSYTQKVATGSGERIRVRIGPYSSREEAEKARAKLAALGLGGTMVSN